MNKVYEGKQNKGYDINEYYYDDMPNIVDSKKIDEDVLLKIEYLLNISDNLDYNDVKNKLGIKYTEYMSIYSKSKNLYSDILKNKNISKSDFGIFNELAKYLKNNLGIEIN